MESVKIGLADAAKARGCSPDYLLALAEAGQIDLYARIGPYSGEFRNQRGEPPVIADARHGNLELSGLLTSGAPGYTTLLPHEAAFLRTGKALAVCVLREPGAENGVRFPFSGDEELLLHLTEPHVVTIDQVCIEQAAVARAALPILSPEMASSAAAVSASPARATPIMPAVAAAMADSASGIGMHVDRQFSLREPAKADVLAGVIFSVLKAEREAGKPLPGPREVMRLCLARNPTDIIEVTHDEIKYVNGNGDTAVASLDAVTKRVKRMTDF